MATIDSETEIIEKVCSLSQLEVSGLSGGIAEIDIRTGCTIVHEKSKSCT